jgi:hypothetical protein
MIPWITQVILQIIIRKLLYIFLKPSLPYGELKFERWASKLLFSLNKRLIFKKS